MEDSGSPRQDTVKQAAAALKKIRPAYTQVVNYYQKLILAQIKVEETFGPGALPVPEPQSGDRVQEGFAQLDLTQWPVAIPATEKLISRICGITVESGLKTAPVAEKLQTSLDQGKVDVAALVSGYLGQDEALFEKMSAQEDIDPEFLRFLVYQGMLPSIRICAKQLAKNTDNGDFFNSPTCPLCGSAPALATYHQDGERHVYCGFCWHLWRIKRVHCPFCQNRESQSLQYLYIEEEKEYRVDLCDKCGKYLKCIDLRQVGRVIDPRLELAATVHLDLKAQEAGYGGQANSN